ncbi:hypothetical protein GBAR_LOCUS4931 [Geodia barretti]|uniref:NADH dehydrogenase subunit 1 n=1 Tax=Geodia barretti TaxID=519541 RepID=A0AA35W3M3_GEOBA|nr:hypothetical protein GBAR_LOCUS4931 [Geodia barretti]
MILAWCVLLPSFTATVLRHISTPTNPLVAHRTPPPPPIVLI